jgi:hypothetical protein
MLAHTPVSRKVFLYFDCNDLAGVQLLRADYTIDCESDDYKAFLPIVVLVLFGFIVALPGVISWYLYRHRQDLYSTSVYQKVGWLYDPFVRGAEWWQIHDVLLKMVSYLHVGGTRCVTSSTDNTMKIRARITLTVECIRTCIFLF